MMAHMSRLTFSKVPMRPCSTALRSARWSSMWIICMQPWKERCRVRTFVCRKYPGNKWRRSDVVFLTTIQNVDSVSSSARLCTACCFLSWRCKYSGSHSWNVKRFAHKNIGTENLHQIHDSWTLQETWILSYACVCVHECWSMLNWPRVPSSCSQSQAGVDLLALTRRSELLKYWWTQQHTRTVYTQIHSAHISWMRPSE